MQDSSKRQPQSIQEFKKDDKVPQESNVNKSQAQTTQRQKPKKTLSKKFKIMIFVLIILLLSIGLSVGLYFRFRTAIQPTSNPTQIRFPDGSRMIMSQFQIHQKNIFTQNKNVKIMIAHANPSQEIKRMLQEQTQQISQYQKSQYSAYINLAEVGFQITYNSDQSLRVNVDPLKLSDYILDNEPQSLRFLQQVQNLTEEQAQQTIQDVQKQLEKVFAQQFGVEFQFTETTVVQFEYNQETKNFEVKGQEGQTSNDRKRLLVQRMMFLKNVINAIGNVIKKIVQPVVDLVRKTGSVIGSVVGGMVGGVVGMIGGPAGVVAGIATGAKIGGAIGLGAQTAVQACVPQNTLSIKCTAQTVKTAVTNAAVSAVISVACGRTICPKIQKSLASGVISFVKK